MIKKKIPNAEASHLSIRRGCILVQTAHCAARLLGSHPSSALTSCINVGKLARLSVPGSSAVKWCVIVWAVSGVLWGSNELIPRQR